MNRITLIAAIAIGLLVSCKTSKNAQTSSYVPPVESATAEVANKPGNFDDSQITVKSENFDVAQGEDTSKGDYLFYVIIGSFENSDNATIFKNQIAQKGFVPVILKSESGMYRIAVNQTNSEDEARAFIGNIRQHFSEHNDVWLLKKK